MKHYLLLLNLFLISFNAASQTYGNEWINFDQQYYSFPVVESRPYRIFHSTIQQVGIPVATLQTGQYRIYGKEREIPIWVNDANQNGILDDGEYLEFYAERNDGWLDSLLYENPDGIANPQYSLYNDTLLYFLTWSTDTDGLRFIQETDVNYTGYPEATYVISTSYFGLNSMISRYYEGERTSFGSSSYFTNGEGWGRGHFNGVTNNGSGITQNLSTNGFYNGPDAPLAKLQTKVTSNSSAAANGPNNHHLQMYLNGNLYEDTVYAGYKQIVSNTTISPSVFSGNNAVVNMVIPNTLGALTDFQALTYGQLDFAKNLAVSGNFRLFKAVNHPSSNKKSHKFFAVNGTNPNCFVWNGSVPKRLPVTIVGNNRWVVVPNAEFSDGQNILIFTDESIVNIGNLTPVNGTGSFTEFEEENLEEVLLFITHSSLMTGVSQYEEYRESAAGGAYNVLTVDVDELYLQYGGGIPNHALGIRRFVKQVYDQASDKPVGLFLIGKAVREADESGAQPGTRKDASSYAVNLVPSFGFPSSDIGFSSRFNDNSFAPSIPTGRLAARTNQDVINYLNKVKQHDLNQDPNSVYNSESKDWQKHVLHFGGGSSPSEINQLSTYLSTFGDHLEEEQFAGIIHQYIKTSSDPFGPTVLNEVRDRIDNGVSIMTFFSHAAGEGFEINIDQPDSWDNTGKYPLVLGLSCYTGDMFLPFTPSTSETFVLVEEKGAIGFLSTVKQGFSSFLFLHANELYQEIGGQGYGKTLGENLQETVNTLYSIYPDNLGIESTAMQMNLHGDPMIRMNYHENPEIEITNQSVSFTPTQIDLATQDIQFELVLKNLGKSILDTFAVELTRNFPGINEDSVYVQYVPFLHYTDTLTFTMPVQQDIALGLNQFSISVDIPSLIDEQYDEINNNQISVNYLIDIGGIIPVYPYNYAVVPNNDITVMASTINPFAETRNYRFEIDTTDLFNSPELRYFELSSPGGILEVEPTQWLGGQTGAPFPLVIEDSMVFFWRVSQIASDPLWMEQSFQYIEGKSGWGQDHFYQFKNNNFSFIDYNRDLKKREFFDYDGVIRCNVYDDANNINEWEGTNWYLNGSLAESNLCGLEHSIHVAVIDPNTLEPWKTAGLVNGVLVNQQNSFGNANDYPSCRTRPEGYFLYRQTSQAQLQAFENFIMNVIPDGHYVLIYTPIATRYDLWDALYPQVYDVFTALQSNMIVPGNANRSFIFFGQKGNNAFNQEIQAQNVGDFITLEVTVPGVNSFGIERSVNIGPAASWHTAYWKQSPLEFPVSDSTNLKISGLDWGGNQLTEMNLLFTENDSLLLLNDTLDAADYPYLRLQANYTDELGQTPAQIDRWHILYEELPEAAIDASNGFYWSVQNNVAQEGQTVHFAVDIANVGNKDMDSLLVHYWIQDQNYNKTVIPYNRQDSLKVGEVLRDTISFSTTGLNGFHTFWIEVNPYVNGSTILKDQPEQFHFNNIAQLPFTIEKDEVNPILDVTFDGIHILNGDIVSPKSEVVISLKDENPFLLMDSDIDTALFAVYLKDPNGIQRRVYFIDGTGQVNMEWVPASNADNNKFKIIYHGDFPIDGTYQLLVQGQDVSGNISGDLDYRVDFEVIHKSTISYLMNYPNPFSTSTRFVFTLTGEKVPDNMIIQIMTVSGRVVREITMAELGTIRIGRNITEYAWDGRDEFGDPLANGVYLYRVMNVLDGGTIEHRESGADQFFTKEFGKMYLMR